MDIRTRVKSHKRKKFDGAEQYPHVLQFYSVPPTETISLQEFEEFAVERLKVLKACETAGIKHIRGTEAYNDLLHKEIRKTKLRNILKTSGKENLTEDDIYGRKLDHISHFILRLAYCRSEELRRWFLQQELDLFRYRFQNESIQGSQEFLILNNLDYTPIPNEEKEKISGELAYSISSGHVSTADFFKVYFTDALDLVKSRKVYLKGGYAYVVRDDLISILLSVYRAKLSKALSQTSRALPHLEEDERLLPMLCGLSKRYLGQDYTNKKPSAGQITADMIEVLSKKSFPLCMQHLHQVLKREHHLKHGGRMQYGLFLKGIGMSLEEALKFWKIEFVKLIDGDKFDKQYAYNIRHNYGKEGKRADYTPYSCMKIIMSNAPGPGDSHGCPFRHTDAEMLKQKLRTNGLSKDAIEEVMTTTKRGHYQLACSKYFEYIHGGVTGDGDVPNFQHPNQYFEESQKRLNGDKGISQSTPKTPKIVRRVPANSQSTPSQNKSQSTAPTQNSNIDELDDDFMMTEEEMGLLDQETTN
ncbi:DNA primase large subunit [Patella vulgata]|uniref:DNA primase large subunit n=1 Tax=Patella vulgata TaxID=6465 RepID=UPI00217F3ECC|nr:DNA primase large subunit [Patella vulgata]